MCLLSIIIPNYNNGKFLNRCLDSILSAKEQNIEVIVIDDGSIDNSVQVLQKYNDYRLTYYTQANKGVSATRNRGIELAKGKYITFCDADDYYTENAIDDLTGQINMTNEDPDIFVFNAYQETIEENGHRNRKIWTNATSERIDTAATQPIDCGGGVFSGEFGYRRRWNLQFKMRSSLPQGCVHTRYFLCILLR